MTLRDSQGHSHITSHAKSELTVDHIL